MALYDSPYEAQLYGVFDAHKRLVAYGDFAPCCTIREALDPGDYEVRLQLRHEQVKTLRKLRHMPMILHFHLEKALPLNFHWSRAAALGLPPADKPPARIMMEARSSLACFVTAPAAPDAAQPGDTLAGTYTLARLPAEAVGSSSRPGGFPVSMVVPPAPLKEEAEKATGNADDEEKDPASEAALEEATRALKIALLEKLAAKMKKLSPPATASATAAATAAAATPAASVDVSDDGREATAKRAAAAEDGAELRGRYEALLSFVREECVSANADEQLLTLMSTHLASQASLCDRSDPIALSALVAVSEEVIALIDSTALAAEYGVSLDKDDRALAKQRKKADAQKGALVAALHAKALARADLLNLPPSSWLKAQAQAQAPDPPADSSVLPTAVERLRAAVAAALQLLDDAVAELHKWAAPSEHATLTCRWHVAHQRFATALEALNESVAKAKRPISKENLERKAGLLEKLGWAHWAAAARAQAAVRFPAAFPSTFNHDLKP